MILQKSFLIIISVENSFIFLRKNMIFFFSFFQDSLMNRKLKNSIHLKWEYLLYTKKLGL